jgi:hypothetical protein
MQPAPAVSTRRARATEVALLLLRPLDEVIPEFAKHKRVLERGIALRGGMPLYNGSAIAF